MKRDYLRAACSTLILACAFVVAASETARAQASQQTRATEQAEQKPSRAVAEKFDEYGRLGHCDWTGRLDNLATHLQNEPAAKAYVIVFDSSKKNYEVAESELSMSHYYLTHQRGIDPSRVVLVNGGRRDDVEIRQTELWIVPEGATPPVAPPETNKFTAEDFSGKFDVYSTDENIYQEMIEVGYSSEWVAHAQFAAKLKQQPESVGYLVIRASKNGAPGAWRRIARRDEGILQKEHGIDAARLRSIDGGYSDGEYAQVELWVLPKSAPPPAGVTEKPESKQRVAYKLNRHDSYGSPDANTEHWMLENLAEALREDPRASAYFIVRESAEQTEVEGGEPVPDDLRAASEVAEQSPTVEVTGAENSVEAAETDEPESETMMETAARLRKMLAEKHGIEAYRIVVVEGRRMPWSRMRLTTWVVPEKARPPDAFARDADEPEEEIQKSGGTAQSMDDEQGAIEVAPPRANEEASEVAPPATAHALNVAHPSYETLKDGREASSLDSKRL